MRFVELRPDLSRDGFELHPRITILRGLDPTARVTMVGFLHSIAGGDAFDWTGVVEVHGIVMALDRALDIIGETAEAALIVEAKNLVDVGAADDAELAAASSAYREAVDERGQIDESIAELADELSGGNRVRSDMNGRLAAVIARLEPEAGRRLDLADGTLAHAARLAERPDPWTGMDDVPGRIVHLEALVEELDAELADLPVGDRATLAAAVATARASVSSGPVACPEAAALAATWTSLHQRLVGLESRVEAAGGGTEAVASRLDAARTVARAAEEAVLPRSLLPDESAHLDELDDRVLELERRTRKTIRRGAARRDYEQARVRLNEALEEFGYPTWAAFRMGNGMVRVTPEQTAAYEEGRAALEVVEEEWADLVARLEQDTDLQAVLDAIAGGFDRAVKLLGHDPYEAPEAEDDDDTVVSDALLAHEIDAETIGVTAEDALAHLRSVLDDSGALGHQKLGADVALVALGETWLAVLASADGAAVRILRDRERAENELNELTVLGDSVRVDHLTAQRSASHLAEADVAEQRESLLEINHITIELHMLAATELAVAEEHDAKLDDLGDANERERLAERRLEQSTNGPSGMASVISRIPRGRAGAIPIVVLMGGASTDVLDALLGLPDDVQAIVLGDTPGLAEWVADKDQATAKSIEVHAFA